MKYFNKLILGILLVGTAMFSCNKDDINEGITNQEKTLIKLPQASNDLSSVAIDATPGEIEVKVLEIRKDAINESELLKAQDIKVSKNTALISDYNAVHGTTYEDFTGFTAGSGSTYDGTTWTVPFAGGDFVKFINLKLDPSKLDLSKKYAIGFSISDAGGAAISNGFKDVLVEIAIKNAYHGTYDAKGEFRHPTAGNRPIDELKELTTTGPNSVLANLGDLGGAGYKMILTVNADNSVTITKAGITPNIDQSWGPNFYDPTTKKFHLFYSYNVAAPRIIEEILSPQ
jgi:hypothetical protein